MKKYIPVALIYDFDGTLAPGNMQERDFIPAIGMKTQKFWNEVASETKKHEADNILIYMKLMLDKALIEKVKIRRSDFSNYGKNLELFKGVENYSEEGQQKLGWFKRINRYGKLTGLDVQHYIISSGIKEMITGTLIAKEFKSIYASSFCYDHYGAPRWPALAINYTTKTQFLFRINKGCLDISDNKEINKYVLESKRKIPFKRMVYIGDGDTDIPCFRLVKDRGGKSIAVFKPNTKGAKEKSQKLITDGRVNFIAPGDYREGRLIDRIIKAWIDNISFSENLDNICQQPQSSFPQD